MKTVLPALLVGMLLGAGLMLAVPAGAPTRTVVPGEPLTHSSATGTDPRREEIRESFGAPAERPSHSADTPFAPGTALLRIGDGYVFGEDHAQPGAKGEGVDVLCLDLRETAHLCCPEGAEAALLPLAQAEGTPLPGNAFTLVENAPADLDREVVELRRKAHEDESGVGLIQGVDGLCYKVVAVKFVDDPHALRRSVLIRYSRVPQAVGGGIVKVTGGIGSSRVDPGESARLRPFFSAPQAINPSRGRAELTKDFMRLGEIPEKFLIQNGGAWVLPRTLDSRLTVGSFASIYLENGVSRDATIVAGFHSGVVVNGEMAGRLENDGSFVRIKGDLTGTLVVDGGTVVIEGDLLGTIALDGIPEVLIKGTVRDPTTAFTGQGIPTIFIGGYTDRNQVMSFRKQPGVWSLHLARSDLTDGRHHHVSFWNAVIVGEEFWEKLLR